MKKVIFIVFILIMALMMACEEGKKGEKGANKVIMAVMPEADGVDATKAKYEPFAKLLAEKSGLDIELIIPADLDEFVNIANEGKADLFVMDAVSWLKVAKPVKPVWTLEDKEGSKDKIQGSIIFHRETAKKAYNWVDRYIIDYYNRKSPVKCMVQDKNDRSYISCVLRLRKEYRIDPEEYLNIVEEPTHDANKVVAEIMKEAPKESKDFYPTDMGFIKRGSVDLDAPGIKDKVYELFPGMPIPNLTIGVRSGLDQTIMSKINDALLNKIPMNDPIIEALGGTRFRSANPDTYANINMEQ
jgi:ABC-type phosphate/phosphonate transport system substrate-binding protein